MILALNYWMRLQKEQRKKRLMNKKLITIVGPTASGKSELALQLALKYGGEIVCADSRTVYQGLNIGTAKSSEKDRRQVKHHLLDVCQPDKKYSAQEFVQQALKTLDEIWSRNELAWVVGGSGMYIDSLLFGYEFRSQLEPVDRYEDMALDELRGLVIEKYPDLKDSVELKNRRRVIELLCRGLSPTSDREELAYDVLIIGLDKSDDVLKTIINSRTNLMLKAGFIDEVKDLIATYGVDAPGLSSTGYQQVVGYLQDRMTRLELADAINRATWKLVKKQRTWFRRNPFIKQLTDDINIYDQAQVLIDEYLGIKRVQ